jgi:hypothetical protein
MMKRPDNHTIKHPFEIFEAVQGCNKQADRVKILQEHESYELKTLLQAAHRKDIVFDLPEGTPPYIPSPNPAGVMTSPLRKQIDVLPLLLVSGKWTKMKKEMAFIRLLENVHAQDAEIIVAAKDKKLTALYSTLTSSLVKKAFPNLGIE